MGAHPYHIRGTARRNTICILLAVAILATPFCARSAEPEAAPPAVTVTGSGEVAVAPDRAVVTVGVLAEDAHAQAAQRRMAAALQRVIQAVRAAGVTEDRVRSTGVSLTPVYSPAGAKPGEAPRVTGYRAMDTVRVQLDQVDRVGAVIDAAIEAGANQLGGLSFDVKDDLPYRRQALQAAVQEAHAKAEAIAAGLGLRLGEVLEAREDAAHAPYPAERRVAAAAAAGTPIQPGQVQVGAAVTVRFKLIDRK